MPIISKFYGLVIKMYFQQREHNPPHFHCIYGEYSGIFEIQTLLMIEGDLPKKAHALVVEWASQHQKEIQTIWDTENFVKIPPLK